MYEGRDTKPSRGIFSGLAVVVLLTILLLSSVAVYFYNQCTADFWRDSWLYPNAAVVSQTSQFLSTQQRVLLTQDSAEVIDSWYAERAAALTRAAVVSGDFSADYSPPPYRLLADPQGNGTRIVFTRNCPDW